MKQLFDANQPSEVVQTERIINTPSEFAKKVLFYVQETGYLKSLKSHLSERRNLDSYLFMLVLSGSGIFTYKGQAYSLNKNDCVLINCMELYSHQSDINSPWELLWVHFNGHSAINYYDFYCSSVNKNVFHLDDSAEYVHILRQIICLHQIQEINWEIIVSKLITDLLTLCINIDKNIELTERKTNNDKLYMIRNYIDQYYKEKILLENLASTFYISKYHLSREFKRVVGATIIDYITKRRITFAKEMLRFTTNSIEDIASTSGYPDASYFNKVFHKIEGMTASEYRRKWRGRIFHS